MGTRGVYGFKRDGEYKTTYNQFDSYPNWLGRNIVSFIETTSVEEMNEIFDKIELVYEYERATDEQVEECKQYYETKFNSGDIHDWYCLLRGAQGSLEPYKQELKYMLYHDIEDYQDYNYIIDLDSNRLIVTNFKDEIYNESLDSVNYEWIETYIGEAGY